MTKDSHCAAIYLIYCLCSYALYPFNNPPFLPYTRRGTKLTVQANKFKTLNTSKGPQVQSNTKQVNPSSGRVSLISLPPPFMLPQLPPSCFNLGLLDLALRPFLHLLSRPVAQLLTWLLVGASRTKLPPFPSSTARSMPGLFPPWGLITPLWAAAFLLRPVPWPLPISFPCLLPLPGLALTSRWHGGASCSLRALF